MTLNASSKTYLLADNYLDVIIVFGKFETIGGANKAGQECPAHEKLAAKDSPRKMAPQSQITLRLGLLQKFASDGLLRVFKNLFGRAGFGNAASM